MSTHNSEVKTVKGACPQDCPDTCAMLYTWRTESSWTCAAIPITR